MGGKRKEKERNEKGRRMGRKKKEGERNEKGGRMV